MNKKVTIIGISSLLIVIIGILIYHSQIFKYRFNKLSENLRPKIEICLEQHKQITSYKFTSDHELAVEKLKAFDATKLSVEEDELFSQLLVDNCSSGNIKRFLPLNQQRLSCRKVYDEYEFFKEALKAAREYKWIKKTKKLIRKQILTYTRFQAENSQSFSNLIVSISLFKVLFDFNEIDKKHESFIQKSFVEAERNSLNLRILFRRALGKDNNPSCDGYIAYHKKQLEYSKQLSEVIIKIIDMITAK